MSKTEKEDLIHELQRICAKLNYSIAFKSDNEEIVNGFIIGDIDFLNDVLSDLLDAEDYEIWQLDPNTDNEIH